MLTEWCLSSSELSGAVHHTERARVPGRGTAGGVDTRRHRQYALPTAV